MSLNPGEVTILYCFLPNIKFKKLFPNEKKMLFFQYGKERKTENLKTL